MRLAFIFCFNPYFTGSNSGRIIFNWNIWKGSGFNPYFTGSNSGSFVSDSL